MVKVSAKTKKINFEIELPEANSVAVVGDFNGWNSNEHPMKKNKAGVWKLAAEIPAGEYQFRYLADENYWLNDTDTPVVANDFGSKNSLLKVEFPATAKTATRKSTAKKPAAKGSARK